MAKIGLPEIVKYTTIEDDPEKKKAQQEKEAEETLRRSLLQKASQQANGGGRVAQVLAEMDAAGKLTQNESQVLSAARQRQVAAAENAGLKNSFAQKLAQTQQAQQTVSEQTETADYYKSLAEQEQQKLEAYLGSEQYQNWQREANAQTKKNNFLEALNMVAGSGAADRLIQNNVQENETVAHFKRMIQYYTEQSNAAADKVTLESDMLELSKWSAEDRKLLEVYASGRVGSFNDTVQAIVQGAAGANADVSASRYQAQQAFNTLAEKYGAETVKNMAESLTRSQNKETADKAKEAGKNLAETTIKVLEQQNIPGVSNSDLLPTANIPQLKETTVLGKVLGNAASVGANLVGAMTSPVGVVSGMTGSTGRYSTLDANNPGMLANQFSGAVREETAADIDTWAKNTFGEELAGKIASGTLTALYEAGMSAADNLARIAVGGEYGSLALAATGSFGSTVSEQSANGASPTEAVALGLIDGALEVVTEKVSLDNLINQAEGGVKNGWQALKAALIAGGVEVSEEELSFLGSTLAEAAILREGSEYNQTIAYLVAQGLTVAEAKEQASAQLWKQAGKTAVQSFLSGGIMSGATSVVTNLSTGKGQAQTEAGEEENATPHATPRDDNGVYTAAQEQARNKANLEEALRELVGLPVDAALQGEQKNTVSEETAVNITSAGTALTEENKGKKTLAYVLASNIDNVRDMAPVTRLTGKEFNNRSMKLSDQIREFFKNLGNKVFRNGLGDVELGEYGVGGMLNHRPVNRAKVLSLAAVPDVIKNGRQINYEPNWKGRGYESYTFAAPVTLAGKEVYVAAIVNKLPDNKFYLSEMVDSEGNYVRIEESPSGNSKNGLPMGPENQQGRNYAGPEELSKEGDPTANAKPTPLSANIISNDGGVVNENSAEQTESVGAAPGGFTGKQEYYDQLTDDNAQPDRKDDVRPMEVLKRDKYGRRVSETAANAYGAEVTPDAMADRIQELINDGALGFDTRTNEESLQTAAEYIEKKGMAATEREITKTVFDGKLKDGDIEKAMLLYSIYANKKGQANQARAAELMVDLATMGNMAGRNLQLFKMLRRMTPEGQLMAVQKNVQRYVDGLNSKRGKNDQTEVNIPQELLDDYLDAAEKDLDQGSDETAEAKQEAEDAIIKAAAAQIKGTLAEKLNAWRYMSMLGNVKTQVRNVVGNAAMRPYTNLKRTVGAAMELMFVEKENRTKAVLGISKQANALRAWAQADAKSTDAQKLFDYTARTGDEVKTKIAEERAVYNTKWLEATREFIQAVPEGADMIFKRWEYSVSLASFLKARGYTAEQIAGGEVSDAVLNDARSYAAQEALKATFNDQNAVSDFVSKRYKGQNQFAKAINLLAEGVLPFRRTPANIAVRAVEYSPVNMVRATVNLATKVRSGEMTAATAIDQMASGITGTAAMALGYALAQGILGVKLVGHLDDEDEKNAGHQAYSLEIGGNSYTIDWAAPANIPLFIGANICQKNQENADTSWFVDLVDSTVNSLEPLLELSCLSSVNDLLENLSYAEDGTALYTIAASAATSYLGQFIPTLFGQIERGTESAKKQTYSDADTAVERSIQKTIGYQTQKIPGVDLFQTQKYDHWGNQVDTQNLVDALVNPSTVSEISTDPVDNEIARLNNAQTAHNVTIDKPSQSITYTDASGTRHENQRLTGEQWETMQESYGQTAHEILTAAINNAGYQAMSDEQKAEVFSYVYDYARETARIAAIEDYAGYSASWMEGIEGSEADTIISKVATAAFTDAFSGITVARESGKDAATAVAALDEAYELYKGLTGSQKENVTLNATGRVADYLAAMDAGISTKTFAELYRVYKDITASGELTTGQKTTQWAYELAKAAESGTITGKQKQVLVENMTISSGYSQTADTSKVDEYMDAGVDADTAISIADLLDGIKIEDGYSTVRTVQKVEAVAGMEGLSESEKANVMKLYLSDNQDAALDRFVDEGYTPEHFAEVYRAITDTSGGKAAEIEAIMALYGISQAVATTLYNLYNGK